MIRLAIIAALVAAGPAWAQTFPPNISVPNAEPIITPYFAFPESHSNILAPSYQCQEQFKDLPRLAKRLGVPPGGNDSVMMRMCDGTVYSLPAIIDALLDRIDKATKP
jgi:hypothetical protein